MTAISKGLGIVPARLQLPEPHPGQDWLIRQVSNDFDQLVILAGQSNHRPHERNWLPFEYLEIVLRMKYPDALILSFQDSPISNVEWSERLDQFVRSLPGGENATLCGSRDSFSGSYTGSLPVKYYEKHGEYSATKIREQLLAEPIPKDPAMLRLFLHGVLVGVNSVYKYPISDPAVDIAVHTADWSKVLMARKSPELPLRFFGGYIDKEDAGGVDAAKRERGEEAGSSLITKKPVVIAADTLIDDPRTENTGMLIRSSLFAAEYISGEPKLGDDMRRGEYMWCDTDETLKGLVVSEHHVLIDQLLEYKTKQLSQ